MKKGDWVEVLSSTEIRTMLDAHGQLGGMPFMSEMIPFCGKRYEVTAVLDKICHGGGRGSMRAVVGAPLLILSELRCDGSFHGGCSRLCTLLWKEAWLKPVVGPIYEVSSPHRRSEIEWPHPTRTGVGTYQCQATAIPEATVPMSAAEKLGKGLADVTAGELGFGPLLKTWAKAVCNRIKSMYRRSFAGDRHRQTTPTESLDLQPGEWVEVKSVEEIVATLDRYCANRGLGFSEYFHPYCGRKYRVNSRVGKFIDERTGIMRELENTVILEGVTCMGETTSGICRRAEYFFWREIWLRRISSE